MVFYDTVPTFVPHWGLDGVRYEHTSIDNDEAGPSCQAHNDEAGPSYEARSSGEHPASMESNDFHPEEEHEDPTPMDDEVSNLCHTFLNLLKDVDSPLYDGCDTFTHYSMVAKLIRWKIEHNITEVAFNNIARMLKQALPADNKLPVNFYGYKKLIRNLGLPVVKIDACREGCMLFWNNDKYCEACKFCGLPRYKEIRGQVARRNQKRVAYAVLRYLPLTPRLQRLYASTVTAPHMTWHACHETNEDYMCHPSDAKAWKHFDRTHLDFVVEPRNVRLGLCSDGFSPYGQFGQTYSCWPVIVTPYNLPPGMCMKNEYMFLSLICPGPKNPKKNIDVFLQPLILELKQLWVEGVETFDASTGTCFNMKAALMWTINDFPAYGMLSGWSTAGLLGCPICMEKTKCFRLQHGKKACYFGCHRQFLDRKHPYRKDKKAFLKGVVEKDGPPPRLNGEEIWNRVRNIQSAIENPRGMPYGYLTDHKWTKKSIFWELPYWKTNLIRHNLDVMHIEKNVFDNVFDTVMDVPGKSKDNVNARKDIEILCDRPKLHLDNAHGRKPKACYTMSKEQKVKICQWVKELRFPDGYSSNLGRCVDMTDMRLRAMKSHDCHVFMQRLIPIAFKEMLPDFIWQTLTELSLFFQIISSSLVDMRKLLELENNVAILLCNLEKIFPPAFFDSMEHILIHLPYEAIVGGPVQYRWMYPFER